MRLAQFQAQIWLKMNKIRPNMAPYNKKAQIQPQKDSTFLTIIVFKRLIVIFIAHLVVKLIILMFFYVS